MKQKQRFIFLITALLFTHMSFSQAKTSVTEYLHVPGPVSFDNASYNLSWSSHPSPGYYKQEYIQKGDNSTKFKKMIMLELATGGITAKDAVTAKMEELKTMKAGNPMVNYEVINNPTTGEYILDFLVSQNNPSSQLPEIVERNVYRYKTYTDQKKQSGVILFAISVRSYGNDIDAFLASLKSNRKDLVNKMSSYPIPAVSPVR